MSSAIDHEFADLEYQETVADLRREFDYCQPFDTRDQVLGFCAVLAIHSVHDRR